MPGDFSGDGHRDVVWRDNTTGDLKMLRGNGAGGWASGSATVIGTGFNTYDLIFSTGDFNGDGKADVLARNASTKNLVMFTGNGTGGWINGSGSQIGTGWGDFDVLFSGGDFNGDGDTDILARHGTSRDVTLYRGNGAGGFTNPAVAVTAGLRHGNGDDNGEHWKLTTADGTQYFFGRSRLPGWASGQRETSSVWTAPVFGNSLGEPCYRLTGFANSRCAQAWRWNLDHVVDPHQNSMTYWYTADRARSALIGNINSTAQYERGGWLDRIEYGTRTGQEITGTPPMRVVFTVSDRCLGSCWSGSNPVTANWPDTPWDLHCAVTATSCASNISPSFWTTKRLAKVTTEVWNGTVHDPVDEWVITHQFPATGETSVSPALWLSNIVHTGKDGGSKVLPQLDFGGTRYANRTDYNISTGVPEVKRFRITRITNEHGGETDITYEGSDCTYVSQADPDDNAKRCFPQYYYPPLAPAPGWSWWNKYRVTKVVEKDLVGGGPSVEQSYAYSTAGSSTSVLWHHADGAAAWSSGLDKRSWSDFRGWPTVTVTTGAAGQTQSQTRSLYFRGMDADRTDSGEGTRDAKITNSLGEIVEDHTHLAGVLFETTELDGAGGQEETKTITTPWQHQTGHRQTATDLAEPSNTYSYYTESGTVRTMTWLAGSSSWRTNRSVTTYDDTYGTVTRIEEQGDIATSDDDTCTTYQYARNTTAWLIDYPSEETTTNCAVSPGPNDHLSGGRVYYDSSTTLGQMGSRGLPTRIDDLTAFSGATPTYAQTSSSTYDVLGRPLTETDGLNQTTTMAYTPTDNGPTTLVTVTNPLGHETSAVFNPRRGLPTSSTDANDRTTTATHDPLGRLLKVWLPGRTTADTPNEEYVYTDGVAAANTVQTKALGPNGNQISAFEIYDGLLRLRQSQSIAPDGKRVIGDMRYNSRGLTVTESALYNDVSGPTGTLVTFSDSAVPTQRRYVHDGTAQVTEDALWSLGAEKWKTTLTYDGDRVNATPLAGGTPVTVISDAAGRTVTQRQYHGSTPTGTYDETTYGYDRLDRLTSVTDSAGNKWTHTYDLRDRMVSRTDPDSGASTLGYDNADQLVTTTDSRNETLHRVYDNLGRLVELRDDNATGAIRASWLYDTLELGELTLSTRLQGSSAYTRAVTGYTDLYQPEGITDTIPAAEGALAGTYTSTATYHPDGSPASTTYPNKGGLPAETVTYAFTPNGYLTSVTGLDTYLATAQYNWHGRVKQQTLGSGTNRVRLTATVDDATGRLTKSEVHTEHSGTPDTWDEKLTENYLHNPAGTIAGINETANGSTVSNQCFGYDYLQRLTEAWTTTAGTCQSTPSQAIVGGPDPYWQSYTYDKTGSRLTDTRHTSGGDTTRTYTYPTSGPTSVRPHAITGITTSGGGPTTAYTYDTAGNLATRTLTSQPNQTLTYDAENHLTQLVSGATTHTYLYDAQGERLVADNAGAQKTLYLGETEYHLNHSNGQVTGTRYYPNAVRTTSGLTWMATDHHGTGQLAIDATTLTTERRRLTPFGETRGTAPTAWPDNKGFVGGTNDPTGYTHLGAREYDPTTGRFISVDPLVSHGDPQTLHAYAYANNNPISFSDPDGLMLERGMGTTGYTYGRYGTATGKWKGYTRKPKAGQRSNKFGKVSRAKYRGPNPDVERRQMQQLKKEVWAKQKAKALQSKNQSGGKGKGGKGGSGSGKGNGKGGGGKKPSSSGAGKPNKPGKKKEPDEGCKHSFAPGTKVALADGSQKPIESLKEGDRVFSGDPESGEIESREVTDTHTNHDTDLTDLTVETDSGQPTVIKTTQHHPFWSVTRSEWIYAADLQVGEELQTLDGTTVTVTSVVSYVGAKVMYDLTVEFLHTYYVAAGDASVLVHNCGDRTHDKERGAEGVREMTDTLDSSYSRSDIWSEAHENGFIFWTPYGRREVDIAVRNSTGGLDLFEVKVNRSNYTKGQRRKDKWLEQTYGFKTVVLRRGTKCPICFPKFP